MNGNESDFVSVISGVPQGTELAPLMFSLYINDINSNILSSIRLFVDDCVVCRAISNEDDVVLLQKDIDEISRWAQRWQMKFNINKCVLLRFMRRHLPLIK